MFGALAEFAEKSFGFVVMVAVVCEAIILIIFFVLFVDRVLIEGRSSFYCRGEDAWEVPSR